MPIRLEIMKFVTLKSISCLKDIRYLEVYLRTVQLLTNRYILRLSGSTPKVPERHLYIRR